MKNIPDLLNDIPFESSDLERAADRLSYAFTTGDSAGSLARFMQDIQIPASNFEPDCFAEDLFIETLIKNTLVFTQGKFRAPINMPYLQRVLCRPPKQMGTVAFRQQIQTELFENKNTQKEFISLYQSLIELRDELDTASVLGPQYFTQKRIDILVDIKDAVDQMASSFSAANSGIVRIRDYGREFQATPGYKTLSEFLDYEGNLASVQLQVRVGADGRLREFKIASVQENKVNRFHQGPLSRLWTRFYMLLCGYNVGSAGLVARWVESVFEEILSSLSYFLELIGHMEFYLAALGFRQRCEEMGLTTCLPSFEENGPRNLSHVFNPLLLQQGTPVVPCSVSISILDPTVILTGPNSGGKTRLLQTVAIVQLLGQGGFWVPGTNVTLRPVSGLFVTLAEHPTADQKEGRLGMELLRIRNLFEKSASRSLVVLDELCSGTNPTEGEEIFHLVISLLAQLKCDAFISTHFLRFAQQLECENRDLALEFLKVEWDNDNKPTYQFTKGVASTSQAKHTASKLGVSREDLLDLVRKKTKKIRNEI